MQNKTILELIEKTEEWIGEVEDAIRELKSQGETSLADSVQHGLLADLEMRLDSNHQWLASRPPTLRELLEWE